MAKPQRKSEKKFTEAEHKALEDFKARCCDQQDAIDPDDEFQWFDMSYGFFLAHKLSRDAAYQLALHVRYDKQYWS